MQSLNRHILIVDDEAVSRETIAKMLVALGYRVTEGEHGEDGLAKAQQLQANGDLPDLLMSDILMPRLDGVGLMRKLAECGIDIPAIAITGYGDKAMVIDLLRVGFLEYLDKPFSLDQLRETLDRVFEKNTASRLRNQAHPEAQPSQNVLLEGLEDLVRQVDGLVRETDAKTINALGLNFGEVIGMLREKSGLSRVDYASAVGIPPMHIAALESDSVSLPTIRDLGRLASFHGLSLSCLVFMAENWNPGLMPEEVEKRLREINLGMKGDISN